jgi:predicted ATPase/transcriptional regulator with XRE-family HTH domain
VHFATNLEAVAESLAELLQAFRSAAHLSQEALSERAGLSTRTISDIETGVARTPRLVTIMLLAEALALPAAERNRLQEAARKPAARPVPDRPDLGAALRPIPLVGRDAAARELGDLLCRSDVRLVTLSGPPGVGKTSLAVRVASERATAFADGAVLVELAPVGEPGLVPGAIALALGARESGAATVRETVAQALRARRMLLVLDNLEHVAPIVSWLAELLESCPLLSILATSREVLHLKAEHVYALRPLDTAAAAALFVQRAQAVLPNFALSAANDAAVTAIVERLEGLPLAIELAAPRLRLLPPKALAARLDRRLPLLGEGALDLPQRHQTMRGAIAWSFDLLSAEEQSLFAALATLHGGGSLEAARALAGADERDNRSFLLRLAALVEKSMLVLEETDDGEPRVAILEMLREYAYERLEAGGELAAARARHAAHFLEFARTAQARLNGADQAVWVRRLEREHPNLRAALQWGLESNHDEFGLRLVCALWRFWWTRGYWSEGVTWCRRFLDAAAVAQTSAAKSLRADALRALAALLSALGDFGEALEVCREAEGLQRELGNEAGLASTLTTLGIALQFRGDASGAMAAHEESLEIRRRLGDEPGIAKSLSNLASISYTDGEPERTVLYAEESAAIYRRLGNSLGVAHALVRLGLVAAQQSRFERAERLFAECLHLHRELENTGGIFNATVNLAGVALKRGQYDVALARLREALGAVEAFPNKAAIAATFESVAAALTGTGDPQRAVRILGAADALRRAIGSPVFPAELAEYEANIAALRNTLGAEAYDDEWQIGATMSLERTLDEVRGDAPVLL